MPKRAVIIEPGVAYHIYNRGFLKQQIFFSERDYSRFCEKLTHYLDIHPQIYLLGFALLPNHFHFLITLDPEFDLMRGEDTTPMSPDALVAKFMGKIQQSHALYLKELYAESMHKGAVFEGRFKSKPITDDAYLDQVQAYINLNPVKHGIVDKIEDWPWTSAHQIFDTGRGFGDLLPTIRFPDELGSIDTSKAQKIDLSALEDEEFGDETI